MNLAEIEWRTSDLVGKSAAEVVTDPPDLRRAVNVAYAEILDVSDWSFLRADYTFDTVAGTAEHTLTVPMENVDTLEIEDGPLLHRYAGWNIDDGDPSAGEPTAYVLRDPDTIELFPTPDSTYTIRVRGYIAQDELDADADVPLFKADYHEAIAYLAAATILADNGEADQAARHEGRVARFVERMRLDYERRHDRRALIVGGGALRRPR